VELLGIHHLTAVSAKIRDNYRFGEKLVLPPFLEHRRADIESQLKTID
jgi:hypothetical protein